MILIVCAFLLPQCLSAEEFVWRVSNPSRREKGAEEPEPNSKTNVAKISKREVGRGTNQSTASLAATANDLLEATSGKLVGGAGAGENDSSVIFRNESNGIAPIAVTKEANAAVDQGKKAILVDSESLWNICPILLYQLLTPPSNLSCLNGNSIVAEHIGGGEVEEELLMGEDDRTLGEWFLIIF